MIRLLLSACIILSLHAVGPICLATQETESERDSLKKKGLLNPATEKLGDALEQGRMNSVREEAQQLLPVLEAGDWRFCGAALSVVPRLRTSDEAQDEALGVRLMGLCRAALEDAFAAPPSSTEDRQQLSSLAATYVEAFFEDNPPGGIEQAEDFINTWEKAFPDDLEVRVCRLGVLITKGDRAGEITLASELADSDKVEPHVREWAREVLVANLLEGSPSEQDLRRAEAIVGAWLEQAPGHLPAKVLLLQIHVSRDDLPAQWELALNLLQEPDLDEEHREWVRVVKAGTGIFLGKAGDLEEEDWRALLKEAGFEELLNRFGLDVSVQNLSRILLVAGLGVGTFVFLLVAVITRHVRKKPPGFWLTLLWLLPNLFASTLMLASHGVAGVFSCLWLACVVWAVTGKHLPLPYLRAVPRGAGPVWRQWLGILALCLGLLLLVGLFDEVYQRAFTALMDRKPDVLMTELLRRDTLPGLCAALLVVGVFIPVLEEVAFRGVFYDWLARRLPWSVAVAMVSITFGLIHGFELALPIMFVGVVLSWLRRRYQSLWPCILLHSLNNSLLILALYFYPSLFGLAGRG